MNVQLIIDDRERAVTEHKAEFANINCKVSRLGTADYIITRNDHLIACIERKSLDDFAASIKDGRSDNIAKLCDLRAKTGCRIIYLIEGKHVIDPEKKFAKIAYKNIESSIFHLIARDNICVLRTNDTLDTAKVLARFVRSMETLREFEGSNEVSEFTAIANDEITALITQQYVKTDLDHVRCMWASFRGITVESADQYIRAWSLADILLKRVSREEITLHKLSTGRKLSKNTANALMAVDKGTETRLLSNVPRFSRISANYILVRNSLDAILRMTAEAIAELQLSDKKKVGLANAATLLRLFDYCDAHEKQTDIVDKCIDIAEKSHEYNDEPTKKTNGKLREKTEEKKKPYAKAGVITQL